MELNDPIRIQVKTPRVVACGISDPGRLRTENQDSIFLDEKGNFMLLADGMGGHERGSEASESAIKIIKQYLTPEIILAELQDITDGSSVPTEISCLLSLVDTAVNEANTELYNRNKREGLKRYMGTTVVGLVIIEDGYVLWFHIGDSRLYRWRDSNLDRLTVDHSAYEEWVRRGRSGVKPGKNVITKAIGPKSATNPDVKWEAWDENDTYILCCDGLTDMVPDHEIAQILAAEGDVGEIANRLISAASDAGGKDNISVVVCKI